MLLCGTGYWLGWEWFKYWVRWTYHWSAAVCPSPDGPRVPGSWSFGSHPSCKPLTQCTESSRGINGLVSPARLWPCSGPAQLNKPMENLHCFASGERCPRWEQHGGSRASPGRAEPWRSFTVKAPRERYWSQLEEVQSGISYKSSLLLLKQESPHMSTVPDSGESPGGVEAGWHHEEKEWIHVEGDASKLNSRFCQLSCALQSRAEKGWAPRDVQYVSFLLVTWVQFWDWEPVRLLNKR